jgi:hypothetical protein
MEEISDKLYADLEYLGIIDDCVRSHNVGKSNYSERLIQPWTIWLSYPELTSFDHDIIKRVLRTKEGDSRRMDYEKIIHICKERIRQIDVVERYKNEVIDNEKRVTYPKKVFCTKTWIMNDGDKLLEMFTENRYYNQPSEDVIMDNDNVSIYVTKENFKKYFKV